VSHTSYRIEIISRARKDYRAIPQPHKRRVRKAVYALASDPRPSGSAQMRGPFRGLRRIRVGDYRVVYKIEDDKLTVLVVRIGSRKIIYQSLLRFLATLT